MSITPTDFRTTVRRPGLAGWALALVLGLWGSALGAQDEPPGRVHAVIQPGVEATAGLGSRGGWTEEPVFFLYFLSDRSEVSVQIDLPRDRVKRALVATIETPAESIDVEIQRCRVIDGAVQCRTLKGEIGKRVPGSKKLLQLTLPAEKIDWGSTFFRITIPAGGLRLRDTTGVFFAPAIEGKNLPLLPENEEDYLEAHPFLAVELSPLARAENDENVGFNDLTLDFEGGIYRPSHTGNLLWHLDWEGSIANRKQVAFDRLALGTGMSVNLFPRDWLPLSVGALAESDRDFDAVDVSGELELAYVLPMNIDLQQGEYRPSLSPRVRLRAAPGSAVRRDDPALEEDFFRAGYEVNWTVPVHTRTSIRFHHGGTWNIVTDQRWDWHPLWDILVETQLGEVTYFVGYQRGEAAPLFAPTETTRAGITFRVNRPQGK